MQKSLFTLYSVPFRDNYTTYEKIPILSIASDCIQNNIMEYIYIYDIYVVTNFKIISTKLRTYKTMIWKTNRFVRHPKQY